MELTVSANWNYVDTNTKHVAGYKGYRLAIAGYTAVVEEIGPFVFEYTVLRDHFGIVQRSERTHSLETAQAAAEDVIRRDVVKY